MCSSGGGRCGLSRHPGEGREGGIFIAGRWHQHDGTDPHRSGDPGDGQLYCRQAQVPGRPDALHLYTLSPQTKGVVKNLKDEVRITAIYQLAGKRGAEGQRARDLLKRYKDISPKIKFEMLDPVAEPAKAMAKGVQTMDVIWDGVRRAQGDGLPSAAGDLQRHPQGDPPGGRREVYPLPAGERDIESAPSAMASPTRKTFWRS